MRSASDPHVRVSQATVLLLGLDNAGKTTLLYKLKEGKLRRFTPTQRPGVETVEIGNVRVKAWDLGGHKAVRDIWEDYYTEANAYEICFVSLLSCAKLLPFRSIIFMLDLSDDTRLEEAREALQSVLAQSKHVPMKEMVVLVVGNKCDKPTLLQLADVERFFNLEEVRWLWRAKSCDLLM